MTSTDKFIPTARTDEIFTEVLKANTAVFIDAENLSGTERSLGLDTDYAKLKQMFAHYTRLSSITYFVPHPLSREREPDPKRDSFYDWMSYHGYRMNIKQGPPKWSSVNEEGHRTNVDADLIVEAMRMVFTSNSLEQIILLSGDGDFISMINAFKPRVRSIIMSSDTPNAKHVSHSLKRISDGFIDLSDLKPFIARRRKTNGK